MRVYLDDKRVTPEGFDRRVYTAEEAIELIEQGQVTHFSFDNDLGTKLEGYDVAKRIELLASTGVIPKMTWEVHSANAPAKKNIIMAMRKAEQFWEERANRPPKPPPLTEADRGKSTTEDGAYSEGYAAKYQEWNNRDNPYPEDTPLHDAFDNGYAEAVAFTC